MSEKHTSRRSGSKPRTGTTDWARVDAMTDEEIDAAAQSDPEAAPTNVVFWQHAKVVMPGQKQAVSLRLDPDVLAWFKSQGKGYQTRINAVLRSYMEHAQNPR